MNFIASPHLAQSIIMIGAGVILGKIFDIDLLGNEGLNISNKIWPVGVNP
jgi:phosphoribosyl-dephospho-CoA transferase